MRTLIISGAMLLIASGWTVVAAQNAAEKELETTRALLAMDAGQMKARIESMSGEEAARVLSQVRFIVKDKNPDADKIYYVLEHLESVRASELAQRRLNNLLLVIVLTLTLFVGYMLFLHVDQRRAVRRMEAILAGSTRPAAKGERSVYRGEG